jgi:hypothetical protein
VADCSDMVSSHFISGGSSLVVASLLPFEEVACCMELLI